MSSWSFALAAGYAVNGMRSRTRMTMTPPLPLAAYDDATTQSGVVVTWECATATVPDKTLQWLLRQCDERIIVCSATAFHATEGEPANRTRCPRGPWNDRMRIETGLSMLTLVSHFKKVMPRVWEYCQARLAFTMAAFHVLVQWYGLPPEAQGFVPLSIAEFSL